MGLRKNYFSKKPYWSTCDYPDGR